jgi:hypothetical protein
MRPSLKLFHLPLSLAVRALIALLGLVTVGWTRSILSDQDFVIFSLALFAYNISAAVLFPLNRRLWAQYSPDVFSQTIIAGTFVHLLTVPPALFLLFVLSGIPLSLGIWAGIVATYVYSVAQLVSRYSYVSFAMQKQLWKALVFLGGYIILEIAFLGIMHALKIDSYVLRILGPAILFCLLMPVFNRALGQTHLNLATPIKPALQHCWNDTTNWTGLATVGISLIMTAASMGDRIVFPAIWGSDSSADAYGSLADLVLISIYCTAYLSILNLVIDWLRPRVFFNGQWLPGAHRAQLVAFSMFLTSSAAGITIGWFLMRAIGLIPETVTWPFWALMVLRYTIFASINALQVDMWMSHRIADLIPRWLVLAAATPICLFLITPHYGMISAIAAGVITTFALMCYEMICYLRRFRKTDERAEP